MNYFLSKSFSIHTDCVSFVFDVQTVVKVKEMLLAGPDSTQVESEIQMYLLALKNALLPEGVPVLTKYAESEVGAYSTIAITALQRYDPQLITTEVISHSPITYRGR